MIVTGPGAVEWQQWVLGPAVRDMHILLPGVVFWFFVQYVFAPWLGKACFGKRYLSLSVKARQEWDIRIVSGMNGLICFRAAYVWFTQRTVPDEECNLYAVLPGFDFSRAWIVSYFIWDLIVCVLYSWGPAFIVHAVASLSGAYFLQYPLGDRYGPWYTGVFELGNVFFHTAKSLQMVNAHPKIASVSETIFATLFFFVRVIGGTYYGGMFVYCSLQLLASGTQHATWPVAQSCLNAAILQVLQYYWFWLIVKAIKGTETA